MDFNNNSITAILILCLTIICVTGMLCLTECMVGF